MGVRQLRRRSSQTLPRPKPSHTLKSIRSAAEQLARKPDSPEVNAPRTAAGAFEMEVEGGALAPPTEEPREAMTKKVLALQVAVMRVARRPERE